MARFPSIDEQGQFEAPEVQDHIKELVTGSTDGITVDTSVGAKVTLGEYVIYYDTGRRNITDSVITANGWDASPGVSIIVARSNLTVELEITNMSHPGATGWTTLLNLPQGFRPRSGYVWGASYRGQSARVTGTGAVQISSPVSQVDYISFNYFSTRNTLPTTLPGSPV